MIFGGSDSVRVLKCGVSSQDGVVGFNDSFGRFKASIGDFSHRELFMVGLLSRNDWSIGDKEEMDSWVGSQFFVDNLKMKEKNY